MFGPPKFAADAFDDDEIGDAAAGLIFEMQCFVGANRRLQTGREIADASIEQIALGFSDGGADGVGDGLPRAQPTRVVAGLEQDL